MDKQEIYVEVVRKADVKVAICETCPGRDMCERIDCDKLRAIDGLWTTEIRLETTTRWQ